MTNYYSVSQANKVHPTREDSAPSRQVTPVATTRLTRKGALAPLCRGTLSPVATSRH
ncbi:hypothetical protein QUB80_06855 [Chlorogloeopsis sp. ULAP01]|uniref:hypothetical protein n=1 Tax=Chlorogloeopsis sp. ULAP01 TaxID=3056483 RepID=UPI0025AABE7A|nr:hypothetical protein [Chlorogloeopsis sp. ULAP01]MDM9380421.1 hypothetical protein [Chlorogloeopsis sp. ULAP01]